ncbi:MAG: sigma-70 family RNA polymerase sigma factor [Nocardioidaceae bacterium]
MEDSEFDRFFRAMYPRLVRYALRWLDRETAREVALETLITVWDHKVVRAEPTGDEARLVSFAFRTLDRHILNALRGQRRRERLHAAVVRSERTGRDVEPDIADEVVSRLGAASWPSPLDELTDAEREVLGLARDQHTVAEIAEILGVSAGAARERLRRARTHAARLLERGGAGDDPSTT